MHSAPTASLCAEPLERRGAAGGRCQFSQGGGGWEGGLTVPISRRRQGWGTHAQNSGPLPRCGVPE